MAENPQIPGLGTFLKITDPAVIEIAALAGLDFVIIDMEHGPYGFESVQNMVRAANCRGIKAIIRVGILSSIEIQRALDTGCDGIQVPQINNSKDAEACVKYAKFFPAGERGMCRFVRAANYSATDKREYFEKANEKLVIVHIEGNEGIANLESIMQVEGIDIYFLGPYDLSQSCGKPGEIKDPEVVYKMLSAVETARKKNKFIGTFTDSIEDIKFWREKGVKYIAHSVDTGILKDALENIVNTKK
jgi:4-hydroxy-2-oxoheptanedioate aldolase